MSPVRMTKAYIQLSYHNLRWHLKISYKIFHIKRGQTHSLVSEKLTFKGQKRSSGVTILTLSLYQHLMAYNFIILQTVKSFEIKTCKNDKITTNLKYKVV